MSTYSSILIFSDAAHTPCRKYPYLSFYVLQYINLENNDTKMGALITYFLEHCSSLVTG